MNTFPFIYPIIDEAWKRLLIAGFSQFLIAYSSIKELISKT